MNCLGKNVLISVGTGFGTQKHLQHLPPAIISQLCLNYFAEILFFKIKCYFYAIHCVIEKVSSRV